MRLASKIFLTSVLVIVVLAAVGILSLGAIGRLVSVNREITTQAVPAMRLATAARDAMSILARMEARLVVMRDPQYAKVWNERAAALDEDLRRLRDMVKTSREREALAAVTEGFVEYLLNEATKLFPNPRSPEVLTLVEKLREHYKAGVPKDPAKKAIKAGGVVGKTDTVVSLNATWGSDKSLKGKPTLGTITIGCALGYLDFRFGSHDWRAKRPKLAKWFATFSKLPSMKATVPPPS